MATPKMTAADHELASLRATRDSLKAGLEAYFANPNRSEKVIGMEKRNLAQVEARIAELEPPQEAEPEPVPAAQ